MICQNEVAYLDAFSCNSVQSSVVNSVAERWPQWPRETSQFLILAVAAAKARPKITINSK